VFTELIDGFFNLSLVVKVRVFRTGVALQASPGEDISLTRSKDEPRAGEELFKALLKLIPIIGLIFSPRSEISPFRPKDTASSRDDKSSWGGQGGVLVSQTCKILYYAAKKALCNHYSTQ